MRIFHKNEYIVWIFQYFVYLCSIIINQFYFIMKATVVDSKGNLKFTDEFINCEPIDLATKCLALSLVDGIDAVEGYIKTTFFKQQADQLMLIINTILKMNAEQIELHEEPEWLISETGQYEHCYFCGNSTKHWHEETNQPICLTCSRIHVKSEIVS